MSVPSGSRKNSVVENVESMLSPATRKGQQEDTDELEITRPADFDKEKARRSGTSKEHINFLYCIVFPAKEKKPSGVLEDFKSNFREPSFLTQAELDDSRHEILLAIEDAGFVTESVYSSLGNEIIVKIGCNDERLLKEAELAKYKLALNSFSVQHVLELKIKNIDPDAVVDKPTNPVYLGYANYTEEEFNAIQNQGGEGTLPIFRTREFLTGRLTENPISLSTAQKQFRSQTGQNPFKYLHFEYDSDWEQKIIDEHNVQLYSTYRDGTILRTVDRIFLIQQALAREAATRNGFKGAQLNLKNLKFKKKVLGFYPIQYSEQIRKAADLSSREIFRKFVRKVGYGKFKFRMILPYSQPVQDIRDYCGEKIAYYFSFLEFYSLWLSFSAFFGFIVFILQLARISNEGQGNIISQPSFAVQFNGTDIALIEADVADETAFNSLALEERLNFAQRFVDAQDFTSDRTPFATDVDGLNFLVVNSPIELPLTISIYAIGISFWASFFLEFWKRRQARLAFKWGTSDYEQLAQVRPEFKSSYDVPEAVTGLPTPYRSPTKFAARLTGSVTLILSLIVVTIAAFAATYVFKAFASRPPSEEDLLAGKTPTLDPTLAVQVALVLNAVVITILGTVFKKVGKKLTDWENHRTDVEYEDQLIGKTFVFSFFNSYTTLVYFAFIKSGTNIVEQNQYCIAELEEFEAGGEEAADFDENELFRIDGCYGALGYSLVIIFMTQIIVNNASEIGIPAVKGFMKKYFQGKALKKRGFRNFGGNFITSNKEEKVPDAELAAKVEGLPLKSPAETQFLLSPYDTPFYDYLELALQYGYVTLFVAAFPLAPFLALINNFIEVWVDANKVCIFSRRPNVSRAQDIGTWLLIFEVLSYLAIITNSGVLVFTSFELLPIDADKPENEVWVFLGLILGIFAVKYVTDFFIKDTPESITIMLKRQEYIKQQIFFDGEDDTELLVVKIDTDKKKKGDEGYQDEALKLFARFEPVPVDPYMTDIVHEVREKMLSAGLTKSKLFAHIDTNNSGFISLKELKKVLLSTELGLGGEVEPQVVALFVQALDIDGDGTISKDELDHFLEKEIDTL